MSAAPSLPDAVPVVTPLRVNHGIIGGQMSHTKVFDARAYRARFAAYWSEFLKANYRNTEEVAVAFGVRHQTAVNWWQGANRPTGDVVALVSRPFAEWMEGRS